MHIPISDAKGRLTDLVRRARDGEDVVLTRHGHPSVRLVPIGATPDRAARRAALQRASLAAAHATPGPDAARSQDFLYDEDGLPA